MKIKLLNDGGFHELSELTYPKEVEATRYKSCGFDVPESELTYPKEVEATRYKICGFDVPESEFGIETNGEPFFFLDSEVEVVE